MADAKNIYEQLEELKEQLNEANKPRTLDEQLANNDPAVIEFVKNAKRVWHFYGDKSELRRLNKVLKFHAIARVIALLVPVIVMAIVMVSQPGFPLAWLYVACMALVNGALIVITIILARPRLFEVDYYEFKRFGETVDIDDNDIVCNKRQSMWLVLLKIISGILIIIGGCVLFLFEFGFPAVIMSLCMFVSEVLLIVEVRFNYQLIFVNNKNEISYHYLKDFLMKNNLK